MTGLVASNFAYSSLAGNISNTATSIALQAGSGALFPQLTGNQYFMATLIDAATGLEREIVKVISITGDTVTVIRAQEGTTSKNWLAGDYFRNLFTAGQLATLNQFSYYTWDRSSPPATDVYLNRRDEAFFTFESVNSVPLTIQTVPGLYRIILSVTASNSNNTDVYFFPNNTTYSAAFSRYSIEASDQALTGFGSSTSDAGFTAIQSGVPGFIGGVPFNAYQPSLNAFFIDMFDGPSSYDSVNDRGPFLLEILASTVTGSKFLKSNGIILGGAHVAGSFWADTVTGWTSLGTVEVWSGSGATPDNGGTGATLSGSVTITRLG